MRQLGLLARERIVRRTISGRDMNDRPFQPYSAAYTKQKAEIGIGPAVNLQLSGAMLNAIQILEVTDKSVSLGFVG